MNKIKLTPTRLFVAAFLLCGLMTIQTPAEPTLQANGKIAFTSDRDGNQEIYLMNADGTGQTRLTNSPDSEDYPTWSPDGSKIAFVRQNGGVSSINLMNADGTNVRQITTFTLSANAAGFGICWSPDGGKIAFQDSTDIFTINVNGGNRVNLTNGQFVNYEPSWSPDGSRIAFARYGESTGNYGEVYTMNVNGGDVRRITFSPEYTINGSPDWSPDGGRITLTAANDGIDRSHLALIDPDGTNLQFILYYYNFGYDPFNPKWSPDGTKIVFSGSGITDQVSQIWVINRDGSGLTRLTNASPNNFHPDWQPLTPELGLIVTRSDDRNNGVCVPGDCSLREAVNAANASPSDDTINFASGLTTITLTNEIAINNAGALTINGLGANILTIDGGAGTNRIFYINPATVTISGVTLTGGNGTGESGGAIKSNGGSLTLDGVHLTGNTTPFGGGGLSLSQVTSRIINSTVSGNTAHYCGGFQNDYSSLTIVNSTISGNTASFGGGFCNSAFASLAVVNSTISGNTASFGGGGYVDHGFTTLRNVTITNNTAPRGAGIYQSYYTIESVDEEPIPSRLNFGNTIVAGNTSTTGIGPEIYTELVSIITSFGGNLVGDSPGDSTNTGPVSIAYQPTDIRDTNPLLGALQNNGGTTPTRALLAGSPIIDKGLNTSVSPLAPAFDQRGTGFSRIRDGNGDGTATVDIGAFEVQLRPTPFDFDGDGRADLSVFRPSNGTWYLNRNQGGFAAVRFGLSTDKLTPADFDGDGKTDIAVFRDGFWYWLNSSNGSFNAYQFGQADDVPVPADFTGDGRAELAVYRGGIWYSWNLASSQFNAVQFGNSTDKPIAADYDGDGRADYAVYRGGTWYLLQSSQGFTAIQFGFASDKLVPADYDGDGKTDVAVFRPSDGNWYVRHSASGSLQTTNWGLASDALVPADYDGDGKADVAVFRNGIWYIRQTTGGIKYVYFGLGSDVPTNRIQ